MAPADAALDSPGLKDRRKIRARAVSRLIIFADNGMQSDQIKYFDRKIQVILLTKCDLL